MSDLLALFYQGIQQRAQQALAKVLKATLTPIEAGTQVGFPWFWQDSNDNFNLGTFNYVSSRVVPGQHGAVTLADPFVDAYDDVLNVLSWKPSAGDQQLLNQAQLQAAVQAGAAVSGYEQTFGAITSDQLSTAQKVLGYPPQKLDFVIGYVAGYLWSGKSASGAEPLSLATMASARHLDQLLPNTPPSGAPVVTAISAYLAVTNAILSLEDASSHAMWLRGRLMADTETPAAPPNGNGGMNTIDDDGNTAVKVGYSIGIAPDDISSSLSGGSSLSISMTASQDSASDLQVSIDGQAAGVVPIDFIDIGLDATAHYSLFQANGSGASASVEMTFPGLTVVPIQPAEWQEDTQTGWFDPTVIAEAVANTTGGTGWTFHPAPGYDFSVGGTFGMLATLVVSQYPTITITYTQGDRSDFAQAFSQAASVSVSLFGIPLGGASESSYSANVSSQSTDGSFTLTLVPPTQSGDSLTQTAYVVAGVVSYPGATPVATKPRPTSTGTPAVNLGAVSFLNQTGQPVEIYTLAQRKVAVTALPPAQETRALTGRLLNIDVLRRDARYSYDLSRVLPNLLLVDTESPYELQQVLDANGLSLDLVISDNEGARVGNFRPSGVLPA